MARKKDTPQKAALREMMGNYLKENNVKVKDGTDVNSIMRDMMSIILEGALDQEMDPANWREFRVGDLFQNIVKPVVLHTRQVVESPEGIPYVVRTKFNNGIKCRVQPVTGVTPSPAGVISWGAENATLGVSQSLCKPSN